MFTFRLAARQTRNPETRRGIPDDQSATASASSRSRGAPTGLLAAAILLLALVVSGQASAMIATCAIPNCPEGCGEVGPGGTRAVLRPEIQFRREPGSGSALEQRYLDGKITAAPAVSGQGQSLFANLPGEWDQVSGFVTFPYSFDGTTVDQLLLRGLPAQRIGVTDDYEVSGLTRSAYWFDVGNGIPRMFSSELIDPNYVPAPGDPFSDSGQLNFSQLVKYRENGRDYSAYPEGAAFATVFFVSDPVSGQVLDAIVDLYDANSEYEKTEYLYEGDSLQPLLLAYRLSEPEFLYFAEYGDFIPLSNNVSIGLANYVPGVDFVDPDLVGFDAANAPLQLLLEGYRQVPVGGVQWAYSAVHPLGYTWGEAQDRLFESGFEATQAATKASTWRNLIRKRGTK
jgi:hypothetical protein